MAASQLKPQLLTLKATGYATWSAMAEACAASRWQRMEGTGSWVLFPAVDAETGAFAQVTLARTLSGAVIAIGDQLGFQDHEWGIWAVRKCGSADMVDQGEAGTAAMWARKFPLNYHFSFFRQK